MKRVAPRSTIRPRIAGVYLLALATVAALFGAFSSSASTALQTTPGDASQHDVTPPALSGLLGLATDFHVFVLEDALLSTGFVEGRVAVGDDATIDGASIGTFDTLAP